LPPGTLLPRPLLLPPLPPSPLLLLAAAAG